MVRRLRSALSAAALVLAASVWFAPAASAQSAAPAAGCADGPCAPVVPLPEAAKRAAGAGAAVPVEAAEATAGPRLTANQMRWVVQNAVNTAILFRLFSLDRNWIWPGAGKAFQINGKTTSRITIDCRNGERIVFGAALKANTAIYYGAGLNGNKACKNCVFVCRGNQITLKFVR